MTVLKKSYSLDKLLGLTKLVWNEGHMELPWRLMHESEAAWTVAAARRTAGAAMAATLIACDVRIASIVCEAIKQRECARARVCVCVCVGVQIGGGSS